MLVNPRREGGIASYKNEIISGCTGMLQQHEVYLSHHILNN